MKFENESKPLSPETYLIQHPWDERMPENKYQFTRTPRLLFMWSRLFQRVVSQAGTFLLSKTFHTGECAIYKCEGGCRIHGVGDLVLGERSCYIDGYYGAKSKKQQNNESQLAQLITAIVLAWNPNDPIESMLFAAAKHIGIATSDLKAAIEKSSCGNVFGGNALSAFFDWNPFSKAPEMRDYERFCLINFANETDESVNKQFALRDLSEELLDKINVKIRLNNEYMSALCCSPNKKGSEFWINTGRSTQIDGWKTREDIESFLASDGILIDKATY